MAPSAEAAAEKTNKASFKDRCNILRETMTALYHGLQNDESVAFHQELVGCFFEVTAFVIWKRIQPIHGDGEAKASETEIDFAYETIDKIIMLPLEDFITSYKKFRTKA